MCASTAPVGVTAPSVTRAGRPPCTPPVVSCTPWLPAYPVRPNSQAARALPLAMRVWLGVFLHTIDAVHICHFAPFCPPIQGVADAPIHRTVDAR